MHLRLNSDWIPRNGDLTGKVTAFIFDSKTSGRDQMEGLEVIFKQKSGSSTLFVYLKLATSFIGCRPNDDKCWSIPRYAYISPLNPDSSYIPSNRDGGVDVDFDVADYSVATKIEVANSLAGDAKYTVALTDSKADVDYVRTRHGIDDSSTTHHGIDDSSTSVFGVNSRTHWWGCTKGRVLEVPPSVFLSVRL